MRVTSVCGSTIKHVDRASSIMQKAMFTMASGQITRLMASEFTPLPKVHVTKDGGETTISMDLVLKICQVAPSTKASITWATKKVKVNTPMRLARYTKANGSQTRSKDMVNRPGKMARCTTDSGKQTTCTDTGTIYTRTR